MPMEYPPELHSEVPAGTPLAESVAENVADLYCACAATEDPAPVWRFDGAYWTCDRLDLPLHDVTAAPPTTAGLIPCQPVAVTPGAAVRLLEAAQIRQQVEAEVAAQHPPGLL